MNDIEYAINNLQDFLEADIGQGDLHMCSAEIALAALCEKVKGSKGCEFCQKPYKSVDSGKGIREKSILYMGGNSPYANPNKRYLHFMDAAGRMDLFEVNFCPMCGKRLKEEV